MVSLFRRHEARETTRVGQDLLADPELAAMAADEVAAASDDVQRLDAELQTALLPRDPDDTRNAFVEVRAGTGGDESALFAADLVRMYLRYAERRAGAPKSCRRTSPTSAATASACCASRATASTGR